MKRHPIPKTLKNWPTTTTRALLEHFVSVEVAVYNQRVADGMATPMTNAELLAGLNQGRIRFELGDGKLATIDHREATRAVIEAFGDGLILIFVDGEKLEKFDDPLELTDDSQVSFVRLSSLRSW